MARLQQDTGATQAFVAATRVLADFLSSVPAPAQLTPDQLHQYFCGPHASNLPLADPAAFRLATLSGFFRLALEQGLIASNPVAEFEGQTGFQG